MIEYLKQDTRKQSNKSVREKEREREEEKKKYNQKVPLETVLQFTTTGLSLMFY